MSDSMVDKLDAETLQNITNQINGTTSEKQKAEKLPEESVGMDKLRELFSEMFKKLEDRTERLELLLEYNQKKESLKQTTKSSGVVYKGQKPRPVDPWSVAARPFLEEKDADSFEFKWGSQHEMRRSLDKQVGWQPVKNETGEEVRMGDVALMKMDKTKYDNAVRIPRKMRERNNREISPAKDLKEKYADVGRAWEGKSVVDGPGLTVDRMENINE